MNNNINILSNNKNVIQQHALRALRLHLCSGDMNLGIFSINDYSDFIFQYKKEATIALSWIITATALLFKSFLFFVSYKKMLPFLAQRLSKISIPQTLICTQYRYFCATKTRCSSNKCIEILNNQHIVIRDTLNAFQGWINKFNETDESESADVLIQDLKSFVEFWTQYTKIHHHIEEEILFTKIADYGFSLIQNHQGMYIKSEHETTKECIDKIVDEIDYNKSTIKDIESLTTAINQFIPFLWLHSDKEDMQLFPKIINQVPNNVMMEISTTCDQFIKQNKDKENKLLQISDELSTKYGSEQIENKPKQKQFDYYFEDI